MITNAISQAYDLRNLKTNEAFLGITTNRYAYNAAGDLLSLIDGKSQTNKWNYDTFGRVTNKLDAAGITNFIYAYDFNNRLTNRWTPAKGNTAYGYDAVGNLLAINYPVSPAINFSYDCMNRLTNMVDAVGTTRFDYTSVGQLMDEDGPWSNDTVTYGYSNRQRSSLNLQQPSGSWTNSYAYDAANRLKIVTSPAGSFGYTYDSQHSTRVSQLLLPGASFITNAYDNDARLLSTILKKSDGTVLNAHSYQVDLGNQRTNQIRISQVFSNGNLLLATNSVAYTYDTIGELKTAVGKEASGTNRWQEQFGYVYDAAGNLNRRTNNTFIQSFNVNNLNQLTTVTQSGRYTVIGGLTTLATNVTVNTSNAVRYADATFAATNFDLINGTNTFTAIARDISGKVDTNIISAVLIATNSYAYDQNGNLRTNGARIYDYDDENQLIRITQTNAWKSEFIYDGKFRRRITKEFSWQGGTWVQINETRFVYDDNLVIQERDTNNSPQVAYTRGSDLSGSLQNAGGIGGLLARSVSTAGSQYSSAYYHADGNGNITALVSGSGILVARYLYDPFGRIINQSGPLADGNTYRFSSKEYHTPSSLNYYLYRFYDSSIQKWSNRDPIHEFGFLVLKGRKMGWHQDAELNLYAFVGNSPVNKIDPLGLKKRFGGLTGGKCCNGSDKDQWWFDDGVWKKLPAGKCTGTWDDCDGITCGGGFYWVGDLENFSCDKDPLHRPPSSRCDHYNDRRWTPKNSGPTAQPPGPPTPGYSGPHRGGPVGNPPPSPDYPWGDH